MKVVIDRTKWARQTRGVNNGGSALLNGQGCMCCLGFVGLACGLTQAQLEGYGFPSSVDMPEPWTTDGFASTRNDSNAAFSAMNINDDNTTSDAEKEAALITLFAGVGYELSFEN